MIQVNTARKKQIQIRFTEEEYKLIKGYADNEGITVSDLVRISLNEFIKPKEEGCRLNADEDVCSNRNCDGITELVEHTPEGAKWVCRKCGNVEIIE